MQSVKIDSIEPGEWSEFALPDVVSGTPVSEWHRLYESEDGRFLCGIWRCTPCTFRWVYEAHEVVTVLSGRATVTIEDGPAIELEPSVVVHFMPGQKAEWTLHEKTTKTFSMSKW